MFALGFDFDGMLAVVMALTTADFFKSMTCLSYLSRSYDHEVPELRSGKAGA